MVEEKETKVEKKKKRTVIIIVMNRRYIQALKRKPQCTLLREQVTGKVSGVSGQVRNTISDE